MDGSLSDFATVGGDTPLSPVTTRLLTNMLPGGKILPGWMYSFKMIVLHASWFFEWENFVFCLLLLASTSVHHSSFISWSKDRSCGVYREFLGQWVQPKAYMQDSFNYPLHYLNALFRLWKTFICIIPATQMSWIKDLFVKIYVFLCFSVWFQFLAISLTFFLSSLLTMRERPFDSLERQLTGGKYLKGDAMG